MTAAGSTTRADIEAAQLAKLRRLIGELIGSNAFYGPRLEAAGLSDALTDLAAFTSAMPFTTKQQLVEDQQRHPPYGTNLTYPIERYNRFHQTSATTGSPMRWLDTPESWQSLLDSWKQVFSAAGVTAEDRVLFAFSFGPFLGFWMAFEAAAQLGCLCIPAGGLGSAARLRMLLDNGATVLCCTPTYALRLAEVAGEEGIDLSRSKIRTIIVAGEPGGSMPATRRRIEQSWHGARVFDHHGMTEVGPVTYEHPNRPGTLRVIESAYLAEVIDPESGAPVAPGQRGELVLTTLQRLGSPLLRYRTGDLVQPVYLDENGEAGEHLCLEGGILGRLDDMLTIRGVNVFPSAVDQILRSHAEVAEYRVEVDTSGSLPDLRIRIEPAPDHAGDDAIADTIQRELRSTLSLRVPVTLVEPESLPLFEMKARRWVRVGGEAS